MNVYNTNGVDHCLLKVRLLNEEGNLVTEPRQVWFHILNAHLPYGANLNGYNNGDSLWVSSSNGIAQISINSGTIAENLAIRASCTDAGYYVFADKENIVVHAGPPYRIDVFAGGYNTGINMGGGLWKIIAGARVRDIYDNPVDYGTSVWFQIPDNEFNCQIEAPAYVGNESAYGDSTAGTAYTTLIYSGVYTFETITIRAITGDAYGQEVFGEADIVLPLNQPQLELEIIPGNIVFHGNVNPTPTSATATINCSVFDIQGCAIRNARISLTSTYGVFEPIYGTNRDPMNCNPHAIPSLIVTDWYDQNAYYEYYYDPYYQIPGGPDLPGDGQEGLAQGLIRFYPDAIPYADPITLGYAILNVSICATLENTSISTTTSITLIRDDS